MTGLEMACFGTKAGAETLNARRIEGVDKAKAANKWAEDYCIGMFGKTLEEVRTVPTKFIKRKV